MSSRRIGLLVLSLLVITVVSLGLAHLLGKGPRPQSSDLSRPAFVLEETENYTLLYVPEQAVAQTYAEQWARGYHCTGLGTRVGGSGGTNGFYWACHNGAVAAQGETEE